MNIIKARVPRMTILSLAFAAAAFAGLGYSSLNVPGASGQAYNGFVQQNPNGTYNLTTTYCNNQGMTDTSGTGYQTHNSISASEVNQVWKDTTGVDLSASQRQLGYYNTPPQYNGYPGQQQYYTWQQLKE